MTDAQESFTAEPCLGLTSLLSKTSIHGNEAQEGGASSTPGSKTPGTTGRGVGVGSVGQGSNSGAWTGCRRGLELTTPSSVDRRRGAGRAGSGSGSGSGSTPQAEDDSFVDL